MHDYNMMLMEKFRLEEIERKHREADMRRQAKLAQPSSSRFSFTRLTRLFRRPRMVTWKIPATPFEYLGPECPQEGSALR
jgi:hypothetical protein